MRQMAAMDIGSIQKIRFQMIMLMWIWLFEFERFLALILTKASEIEVNRNEDLLLRSRHISQRDELKR